MFKQREGKEEEKKSRFGTLIFVSIELWYGTYMYGNYHKPYLFMGCQEKPNFHYESVVGWFLWALVVLIGSSQVLELFSFMCFGFWLEISSEKWQTCRNRR